jgi:hypothetical protein
MTPATVAEMLPATLSSQRWAVRRHEAREDPVVTDPQGTRAYLIARTRPAGGHTHVRAHRPLIHPHRTRNHHDGRAAAPRH